MIKQRVSFYARDGAAWRQWLEQHHDKEDSIWLILYKKDSTTPSIRYPEAVDKALCFGWVDSVPNKRDEDSYYQFFARRHPKSNWSKINKDKVEQLIQSGLMTEAGMKVVEAARAGAWDALNEVEQLIIPQDLEEALQRVPNAWGHFNAFPRSSKRGILEWILNAKKAETRSKRIRETARLAGQNIRANHYRQSKGKT